METLETSGQRQILAQSFVFVFEFVDEPIGGCYRLDCGGIAFLNLVGQLLVLALERKRLADERDRLAGGMAQAESHELEPEDGHRRGPRR